MLTLWQRMKRKEYKKFGCRMDRNDCSGYGGVKRKKQKVWRLNGDKKKVQILVARWRKKKVEVLEAR